MRSMSAGLPRPWRHQPVGLARGMSIHESQSLLMEMQACRSRRLHRLPGAAGARGLRRQRPGLGRRRISTGSIPGSTPGFIRVEADEVTYPAHVILRYRLEKALIGGDLQLADLPAAWNEGMKKLLGIVPPSRPRGLPAGHPLVRRRLGLFPHLYPGRHDGGAAVRGRLPRPAGDPRRDRPRRLRAAARLAARPMSMARARACRPASCSPPPPAGRWTPRCSRPIWSGGI